MRALTKGGNNLCVETAHVNLLARQGDFFELTKHGVHVFKGLVDLFTFLCTGQHNLARDKDQQDDFGIDHSVN